MEQDPSCCRRGGGGGGEPASVPLLRNREGNATQVGDFAGGSIYSPVPFQDIDQVNLILLIEPRIKQAYMVMHSIS